uniref:hypothetical protein n=1 Tax=Micromonospora acroterricola TaxID=2202421 RepID=UPI001F215A75|nr:hypothetical protein [Micromonospora acroterricola]
MSITADRPATIAADPCTLVSAEVFNKITRYFPTRQEVSQTYAERAVGQFLVFLKAYADRMGRTDFGMLLPTGESYQVVPTQPVDAVWHAVVGVDGDWLYAIGDINHRALLTHQGKYQARIVGNVIAARAAGRPLDTNAWGPHQTTADTYAVPQVIFTDPEVGAVGMTAEQAERAGYRVRVVDVDMVRVPGAALWADGYEGRARMVVDLDGEHLLGVTFVGPGIADLLHSATIAVASQVPSTDCGTRSRHSRRSPRCGCDCSRHTEAERLSAVK